jgi:hypothetical protein
LVVLVSYRNFVWLVGIGCTKEKIIMIKFLAKKLSALSQNETVIPRQPRNNGMHASLLQEFIEVSIQDGANIGELFWLELPPGSANAFSESIDEIGGGHDLA